MSNISDKLNNNDNIIGQEIRKLRNSKRLNLHNFAKTLGLSSAAQISSWENRRHTPSFKNLLKIKEVYGLDLVSVANNHYDEVQRQDNLYSLSEDGSKDVQFMDRRLFVILNDECDEKERYFIPCGFLKVLNIADDYRKILVYRMMGDSMMPTFKEYDRILVDATSAVIKDGAIYLLKAHRSVFIRHLSTNADKLLLRSQNPSYPEQVFDHADVKIIGLVIGKISANRNSSL